MQMHFEPGVASPLIYGCSANKDAASQRAAAITGVAPHEHDQDAGETGSAQKGVTSFWDGTRGTSLMAPKWQFIRHLLEKQLSLECSFTLNRWNIYSSISHNPFQKHRRNSDKVSLTRLQFLCLGSIYFSVGAFRKSKLCVWAGK